LRGPLKTAVLLKDVEALDDAGITDMDSGPGYKTLYLALTATAERTPQRAQLAGSRMNPVENRMHGGSSSTTRSSRPCQSRPWAYGPAFAADP
jgi:hypothetical protein